MWRTVSEEKVECGEVTSTGTWLSSVHAYEKGHAAI